MYLMFVLMAAGGLTMAASMAPIAKDFKIEKVPVELFGFTMPALVFALSLNRIFDGVGRPFFGWLSDQIGREYTMAIAFVLGAAGALHPQPVRHEPGVFVLVTALYFGVYGEIFSLFPATQGDTFGAKFAATNAGMLYTAKGAGALLVPVPPPSRSPRLGHGVHDRDDASTSSRPSGAVVLKPMRARHFASQRSARPAAAPAASARRVTGTRHM